MKEISILRSIYRRNVGYFRYLLNTRPDLSFAVGVLSRYMQRPKESHGAAMKHCLRYLQGSTSYGLVFTRATPEILKLVGYSDSSHNVEPNDGKSTTGHFLSWQKLDHMLLTKQETVALSSCEAEFMTETKVAKKAICLQELLSEGTELPCERVVIKIKPGLPW